MTDGAWRDPPDHQTLPPDEVHVWRARLDLPPSRIRPLSALLSPDESARAERLRLPGPSARFTAARGCLRLVLSRYLSAEPKSLVFRYSEMGKPELAGRFADRGVRFNLSHSADVALVAVAADRPVGIDVEFTGRPVHALRIAGRFFTRSEVTRLRKCPPEDLAEAFYRTWTRKEARAKAVGEGLRLVLKEAGAEVDPRPEGWLLRDLDPAEGYVAALAVGPGPTCRIRLWRRVPDGCRPRPQARSGRSSGTEP